MHDVTHGSEYRAAIMPEYRATDGQPPGPEESPPLRTEVHERLRRGWSPEEVAGSLWRDHPDLPAMHTSHESIYRYVYVVAGG